MLLHPRCALCSQWQDTERTVEQLCIITRQGSDTAGLVWLLHLLHTGPFSPLNVWCTACGKLIRTEV